MSKLKTLKLQRSYLRKLPNFKNINSSSKKPKSNITSTKTPYIEKSSEWFNPELEVLDVSHNLHLQVLSSGGSDTLFPPNLKKLDFTGDSVPMVNEFMFSNLRSLQSLKLDFTRLNHISRDSFAQNSDLEEVSITLNTLREIPQLPTSVKRLNLMDNRIENVTSSTGNSFKVISNERNVTVGLNRSIKNLSNLEMINLSKGSISFIESGVFKNMNKLTSLNMSDNHLRVISDDVLEIR